MSKNKPRLLDRVKRKVAEYKPGPSHWIDRIPKSLAEEIFEIKRAYRAGEIDGSARGIARAIIEDCAHNGVKPCGIDHLRLWLAED